MVFFNSEINKKAKHIKGLVRVYGESSVAAVCSIFSFVDDDIRAPLYMRSIPLLFQFARHAVIVLPFVQLYQDRAAD